MKKRILEEQVEVKDDSSRLTGHYITQIQSSSQKATTLMLEACQCKHLQQRLPHVLDLTCIPSDKGESSWIMANPVHALHVASHLEPDGCTVLLPKGQPINHQPALYGDEQCRTNVVMSSEIYNAVGAIVAENPYVTKTLLPPKDVVKMPTQTASTSTAVRGTWLSAPVSAMPPPPPLPGERIAANAAPSTGSTSMTVAPRPPPFQAPSASPVPVPSTQYKPIDTKSDFALSEERYQELLRREQLILQQRYLSQLKRSLMGESKIKAASKKKKTTSSADVSSSKLPLLPDSLLSSRLTGQKIQLRLNHEAWERDARLARSQSEQWMERFRFSRNAYWDERNGIEKMRQCQQCTVCAECVGDAIMQCLECNFIGCGPHSLSDKSKQHMMHHCLRTGHNFAVTCGERAQVFCFKCGDLVFHDVFDQERLRIDVCRRLPWMGWYEHPVQRSFDCMQFRETEYGVIWRGLIASYPSAVPKEHEQAAKLSMHRLSIFRGELAVPSLLWGSKALEFAIFQSQQDPNRAWRIPAPVGMYNLGNTCFMSCILQCLMHCVPLQRHFLGDIGHHHKSCEVFRSTYSQLGSTGARQAAPALGKPVAGTETNQNGICLACEMDQLFLQYFRSSTGRDVSKAVCAPLNPEEPCKYAASSSALSGEAIAPKNDLLGQPLVTTGLLAAAWKSGGMDHLAGYEQRDAHEFLEAFLDIVSKHAGEYRKLIRSSRNTVGPFSAAIKLEEPNKQKSGTKCARTRLLLYVETSLTPLFDSVADIIKDLFEGTLRSVLICEECGCKRKIPEPFLNVSLPLSKHVGDSPAGSPETRGNMSRISLQQCLEHFTAPESLGDSVDCPSCKKKTPTMKQHTFAKLPKVLCLHLKRFDAAKNKKISDFVSFPATGLDMGPMLPHWCEATIGNGYKGSNKHAEAVDASSPQILYDLFASANHTGTLHQGHYVANVKVDDQWYHCNDQHVSKCEDEEEVLRSEAYMLFYIRR